ncbi:pyridoxal phosphate-dependent aminotransferase [bacterium]|nr:pyridoxal phosphate-dependent aminotransferase [bacterium]
MKEYQILRNYLQQIWLQGIDIASTEICFLSDFRIDLNEHPIPESMAEKLRNIDKSEHLKEYGNTSGDIYVREAIVRLENSRIDSGLYSVDDIMVTFGATGSASMIYKGFLWPGARILMTPPIYYVFAGAAEQLGMSVDFVKTSRENFFSPTLEEFDAALNAQEYDLVLITNPTYPIGKIFSPDLLFGLLDIVERYNKKRPCLAILDEVYAQLAFNFEDVRYGSKLGEYEFLFRMNSLSKSLGTAGLRLGYFCAHPAISKRIHKKTGWPIMEFLNDLGDLEYGTPPPVFGPYIVSACEFFRSVEGNSDGPEAAFWKRNLARHKEKYRIVESMLAGTGLDYIAPDCAFSVMVELKGARTPQDQFSMFRDLLGAKKVYALPGALYRLPDEAAPMVRVSYGQSEERLREGLTRSLDFWLAR